MIEVFYKVCDYLNKQLIDVDDPMDARKAIEDHLQNHINKGELKEEDISTVLALIKGGKS